MQGGTRITVNDFLMTVMSKTIGDYASSVKASNEPEMEHINIACPVSLRPKPSKVGDFVFNNCFAGVLIKLPIVRSITEGVKVINKDMLELKKSFLDPFAFKFSYKISGFLPRCVTAGSFEDFPLKLTFCYSNVPGPRNAVMIAGSKCHATGLVSPCPRTQVGSFSIMSHVDVIKIVICLDKAVMKDPNELTSLLARNIDQELQTSL